MIIVGKALLERCPYCGKIVKLNKFLFGSAHICLTEKEREINDKLKRGHFPPLEMTK